MYLFFTIGQKHMAGSFLPQAFFVCIHIWRPLIEGFSDISTLLHDLMLPVSIKWLNVFKPEAGKDGPAFNESMRCVDLNKYMSRVLVPGNTRFSPVVEFVQ